MPKSARTFHSKFGGMWVDASDWKSRLSQRVNANEVSQELASKIELFVQDGIIVLPGAASESNIEKFEADITAAFRNGHDGLLCQLPGDPTMRPVAAGMKRRGVRINDAFVALPSALDLLSSPALVEFLTAIFDEPPLVFQSLSFDLGSEQGLHQDTAYVLVNRPIELAACWIALEDIKPGSGELMYMRGSHRLPDFPFGGYRKHYHPTEDGEEVHTKWAQWIVSEGERRGYQVESFLAKRGDILVWHGDAAHGGRPIQNPELTRKSLVGHFCPLSALPHHFTFAPRRARILNHKDVLYYASSHFDL